MGQNIKAVDAALNELREVKYPVDQWASASASEDYYLKEREEAPPAYVTEVLDKVQVREGTELKVSQLEPDGCVPVGQTAYAKRGVAECIPVVDMDKCIQCNVCSAICPHAVIRPFLVSAGELEKSPAGFDARTDAGAAAEMLKSRERSVERMRPTGKAQTWLRRLWCRSPPDVDHRVRRSREAGVARQCFPKAGAQASGLDEPPLLVPRVWRSC